MSGDRVAASLKLLHQMELLKAQLDALMATQTGSEPAARAAPNMPRAPPPRAVPPPRPAPPLTRAAQRVAGGTVAPAAAQRGGGGQCGGGDAFGGVSVEGWVPPAGAPMEATQQWEDARKQSLYGITHFDKVTSNLTLRRLSRSLDRDLTPAQFRVL
jgi:hypothetical protein